tara:strand:+ start:356 stop:877 length:522 start_codon:yes stop_codon:yes gene_type:complete
MPNFKKSPNTEQAFYLKSGNAPAFKMMGSTPLKQIPKNFNVIGTEASTTPWDWVSNMDNARGVVENYKPVDRMVGVKTSTGYIKPDPNQASRMSGVKTANAKNILKGNFRSGVKQVVGAGSKLARFANIAAPPLALYDFWKTGRDRGTLNTSRVGKETLDKMRSYGTNRGFNF